MSKVNKGFKASKIVGGLVLALTATSASTTTLSQSATAARVLTLPDATDTIVARQTADILLNKTVTDISNIILAYWKNSNTLFVDPVNGNNSTATPGGLPYLTIAAALAVATTGQCVRLAPGVYNETNLSPVSGITIRGSDVNTTSIVGTFTTSGTIINMNTSTRIEDLTVAASSSTAGITIAAITFVGASAATGKIRTCMITATNTAAGAVTVYGIVNTGTGVPTTLASSAIRASTINATAANATSGTVRAVYVSGASTMNIQEVNMDATGSVSCSRVSVETNNASAVVNLLRCTLDSATEDYLQTAGVINLYANTTTTGDYIMCGKVVISNASTPAANYVLTAQSSNAASWQPMVTGTAAMTVITDTRTSGTSGGNSTAGTWVQRTLNTVSPSQTWISLASNQFTLTAGTYFIDASAPAYSGTGSSQTRIKNVSATTYVYGQSGVINVGLLGGSASIVCRAQQFVTVASSTVFQIEMYCSASATNGFGTAVGASGAVEVYTTINITKFV